VNRTAGIYIHIPFCERKCTYCNFNTTDFFSELADRYCQAVAQEVRYWGEKEAARAGNRIFVDTIFFGGGTPSIVEAEQLGAILQVCRDAFQVAGDAEITIEINPATISQAKMAGWRRAGINRVSVGVQSFLDAELVSLSRTHSSNQARRTVEALREAGFDNLSLDLIAGLPGQSRQDWQFNLTEALSLQPEHLSLYLLEIKEGTQLFMQVKRGLRPSPDDDLTAEMYEMICRATREAGFEQYEISNFAKKKSLRSQHNMKYWTGAPFYGIGGGAHAYDGRSRRVNTLKTESYIEQIAAQGHAIREQHELSDGERAAEAIFMGLRLIEGINLAAFKSDYGVDIFGQYGTELEEQIEAGLVEIEDGRLKLTDRGRLLSNEVFMIFV